MIREAPYRLIGAYVRDVIPPHVAGGFGNMPLAMMRHPAMLLHLDKAGFTGPESVFGLRQGQFGRTAQAATRSSQPQD